MELIDDTEEIINALLEHDTSAQERLQKHQLLRQQMADEMTRVKEETQKVDYERAEDRIESVRLEYQAEAEEQLRELTASYNQAVEQLEETYKSRREQWVDTLFHRCLE